MKTWNSVNWSYCKHGCLCKQWYLAGEYYFQTRKRNHLWHKWSLVTFKILRDVAEHCVQKLKKNSAVEEGDGSASRSTQPSILPRLIKWVSGISENLVVKVNCVLKVALALRERNLIWILTSKNLFFSKDLRILKKSAATFV